MRGLEVGQTFAREFAQLLFTRLRARSQHDKRVRRLTPTLVRKSNDRYFGTDG